VVGINWNDWSSSIGTGGRHHVVRAPYSAEGLFRQTYTVSRRTRSCVGRSGLVTVGRSIVSLVHMSLMLGNPQGENLGNRLQTWA
jgi:hypothetical protein